MKLIKMPSLVYARDSASYLQWVEERMYARGTRDYSKQERMARESEELFAITSERRHTGEPYHTHIFAVGIIAGEYAGVTDPDVLAACVGHDNREFVEEQIEKGNLDPRFWPWQAESGLIEERFSYRTQALITAGTAPLICKSRSNEASHQLVYARMHELADDREYFQMRLSDRTHNLRTLSVEKMGCESIRAKLVETTEKYLQYADRLGILVHEIHNGIAYGYSQLESECVT